MEVDKKDTSGDSNSKENPIASEVPAEKKSSVDVPISEPVKIEIPAESTTEIKPEAHSEHTEITKTEVKHEEDLTHTKVSDEVKIPHEESKSEDKVPEPVTETGPVVIHTGKDNKDDDETDVIENPTNKAIFTHFVKTKISEAGANDEEIKKHVVHDDHEPEKKDPHEEIKEVPVEIKPDEHASKVEVTKSVEDKPKEDHHKTSEKTEKDFYTIKSSEVEPYYKKFEKEKKSATSEERKETEEHLYECEFSVQYETKFGENVIVVGSAEELGSWDPTKGLNLTWNQNHRWTGTLKFSTLPFEYKYAVKSDKETNWEKGVNRLVKEPPTMPLVDLWQPI
ncbi:hypothetical protein SteCoe_1837 [Stentor coeruleus]|uniref:CBM20 domain-containing protein n=1 Tax=Stentor coeruleus TaxID=5963 RepID=A0A1R2D180_9CILI|nr:hypothetical protein SteCoe_1837 [Stentor coeruleus]